MKDKTGQLSWGLFLITLGSLYFLTKYHILNVDWYYVWDLWPIVLVMWGISVIAKNTEFKPYISMIFGILMGVLVYGSLFYFVDDDYSYDDDSDYSVHSYSEEYDSIITNATLDVKTGAGKFTIINSTSDLVRAMARGENADYNFYTQNHDSTMDVTFSYDKENITLFNKDLKNDLDIKLNEKPIWDLNFKIGAAKNRFDLTNFKVRSVDLETGATETKIKLGDKYSKTFVKVKMGAASLEIQIPKESGCRINGDMVLSSKQFEDFEKFDSDYYKTNNFDTAENRIDIEVEGGVSSFKVKRY